MEESNEVLEQARLENERKKEYFLKKKNLWELKTKMDERHEKMDALLKENNITWQEAYQGIMPPYLQDEFNEYRRQAAITIGAMEYAKGKAHQSGEMVNFDKEFEANFKITQKREVDEKAYEEAKLEYKNYPSRAATQNLIKARMAIDGTGIDGVIKKAELSEAEKMKSVHKALLEKYTKVAVESGAKEGETIEELKKSSDDGKRRLGEFMEKQALRGKAMEADKEFEEQERAAKEKTWKES